MNRRKFINSTSIAAAALSIEGLSKPQYKYQDPSKLNIMATKWGYQGSMDDFCRDVKAEGYDGIEVWVPWKEKERDELQNTVTKHGLQLGLLAGNNGPNYDRMLGSFKNGIDNAVSMKPLFINCHSGRDFYSFEQNKAFIEYGLLQVKASGVPIYHETHRNKILFCTTVTNQFIEAYPELELTLDISHWCCVHGTMLQDQQEVVDKALQHVSHVHSRVGFNNGPQVSEPRAPEYKSEVDAHFAWWDKVVERKAKANQQLTMTTEFGPAGSGYLWRLPYTKQPLADQWDINVHMMHLWRERYS